MWGEMGRAGVGEVEGLEPERARAEAELELERPVDGRHCGDEPQVERHLHREMWGDVGRCGEMWGDVGRCGEMSCQTCEMWGDVGRCGEIWGGTCIDARPPSAASRSL